MECLVPGTLVLLVLHFTICSSHTTYYIKPTPSTSCPTDPCLTLYEYTQQTHNHLTSNTTLLFLPGDHILSVNFTVENVSGFEMGTQLTLPVDSNTASGVRIMCHGLVGFTFRNITHMAVYGLTFNACGTGARYKLETDHCAKNDCLTIYGVSVYLGHNTKIYNCSFQDSVGTALGVFYSSLDLRGSNSFTNSCRGCSDRNHTCICLGGGIYTNASNLVFLENSTFTNNSAEGIYAWQSTLNINGNICFRNNLAKETGGGVRALNSTLNFTGNTVFKENSAEYGGGIGALSSCLYFSGNTSFENNSVQHYGGGISAWKCTLSCTGNTTFANNSAQNYGGGIYAEYNTLNFTGNTDFRGNSALYGGGIFAKHNTIYFTGSTTFRNNSVEKIGGGIAVSYSILNFSGNTTFRNNSAENDGGGIGTSNSTLNFIGNTTFRNNSAVNDGGGIGALNSTLNLVGNTTFRNNSAENYGGGFVGFFSTLSFNGNTILGSNSAKQFGGGIYASNSTLNFADNTTFTNNSAEQDGGGIGASYSTLYCTGNTTFGNNSAELSGGGGIGASYSTLNFTGKTAFINNSAKLSGGGIGLFYCTLNLTGSPTFKNNLVEQEGGGIAARNSTLNFTGNTTFKNNSAVTGGGIRAWRNILNFNGNTTFTDNSASQFGEGLRNFIGNDTFRGNVLPIGGGIEIGSSILNFTGNTCFRNNSAGSMGGGIYAIDSALEFTGNTIFRINQAVNGGGIYARKSILDISGDNITEMDGRDCISFTLVLMNNFAQIHGGAVYSTDSTLRFEGCNTFSGNSARRYGGGIYSENSTLKFSRSTSFSLNSGQLQGGAIYGHAASMYFSGNNSFTANTAARGGGEYLVDSFNFLFHNTVITMDSNNATEYGGALYVEDSNSVSYCFPSTFNFVGCSFQVYGKIEIPQDSFTPSLTALTAAIRASLNIHSYFHNNHAGISGSAMYGGSIDNCVVHLEYSNSRGGHILFDKSIDVLNMEIQQEPNSISSNPLQVCMCEDGTANCNPREINRQVYPGEVLHFPVVATGQRGGVVPAVVQAFFAKTHANTSLAQFQDSQNVKTDCTDLYYQMRSSVVNKTDTLVLYADGPCGYFLNISLLFHLCPPGFSMNLSERICECEPRLQKYTTRCNITERTLTREGEFWVGYDNYSEALILHPHCPFDYCKPATYHISFQLSNSDLQCDNGRSGFLCGECKSGLSLALGSSKCIQCSNLHISLLFPFALAGIALVLLLLICKLTVAAGTINGLIFYANIVAANRAIFFPPNQTNILTVFIAWLNLDLGIETCFFDGMDAYGKTWLQFIFPLYIWSLVGPIIIASYYSSKFGRLFGSNPVAVLATLFLLSYAKLLRTIIASLFFTFLNYPNNVHVAVWMYDGNIKYLHGKHIVLFLVALLTLLILFLPYTFLLTVGQWLQAKSNRRCFHWINNPRIKPFLDAYHAPYRDQHRYWTGLLVCLRCALLLVFAFNTQADPSLNLLVIGTVVIGLLTLTHFTGFIYRKLYLDILEISFILNLGILAVATYYVKLAVVPASQAAVAYTSVGIAFTTFFGVLLYHTYQQAWPKLYQKIHQFCHPKEKETSDDSSSEEDLEADVDHEAQPLIAPTMSVIECPSPETLVQIDTNDSSAMKAQPSLIDSSTNVNLIEFRDPLDLFNPDNSNLQKTQSLIPPTMNFTELREPLDLIDTDDL